MRSTRSFSRCGVAVAIVCLLVGATAACGDDSSPADGSTSDGGGAAQPSGEPVEGCSAEAATDPQASGADRPVARCEPGAPAAQPLAERASVVINMPAYVETSAFLLLADALGEFESENLDVEFTSLSFADALPQMATGDIDASLAGADAAWFNAVAGDIDVRWVTGNFTPPFAGDVETAQTGLWARRDAFSDPDDPDFSELAGSTLGSVVGPGGVIMYPITRALDEADLEVDSVEIQQLPPADVLQALQQGAVEAAWLLDPLWMELPDDEFVLMATQPAGEPLGGLFFGSSLLGGDDRTVGDAVVRAVVRTVNTYLAGDYQTDDVVVDALAETTDLTAESITTTPSLTWDWEIRSGTTDRMQEIFMDLDSLAFDEQIPEDELVDRSFYLAAVGQL